MGLPKICLLGLGLILGNASAMQAQDFWENNFLLDAHVGSNRSAAARELRIGGYELADGTYVDFGDWYTPQFSDLTMLFLKQVSPDFGIIWGLSSGENAPKYRIDPALQVGFVYQYQLSEGAIFSIKATYPLGGRLQEKTCVADYGEIGGVQKVNCRLAAGLLPPEETLGYLVKIAGETDAVITVNLTIRF